MITPNLQRNNSHWHYERFFLAEHYLKTLSSGTILSTSIYSPPKRGLTNFLIYDLISCAYKNDYACAYIDLSNPSIPITASFMVGLDRVLRSSSKFITSFDYFRNFFDLKSASEVLLKENAFIDNNFFHENKVTHLKKIEEDLSIITKYKTLLLVVDSSENLLSNQLSNDLIDTLTTLLDNHHNIKPLYATSNLDKWGSVFKNNRSPLNSEGAFMHKLPELGDNYLQKLINNFRIDITLIEAKKCFSIAENKPGVFMAGLNSGRYRNNISWYEHFTSLTEKLEPIYQPNKNKEVNDIKDINVNKVNNKISI